MPRFHPGSEKGLTGLAGSATLFVVCLLVLFGLRPAPTVLASTESKVATVVVKSEISVKSDRFTLGDIADVRATLPQFSTRLREIALGYSPQVGAIRELTRQRLQLAIAGAGIAADLVELSTPPIIKVRRQSQRVDQLVIRKAVETSLFDTFKSMGAEAHISSLDLPAEIEVPMGNLQVRASAASAQNLLAPFPVGLELVVDGQVVKRLAVAAQVEAFAEVVVASHDLSPGKRLTPEDFTSEKIRLDLNPRLYVTDKSTLKGKSLAYPVKQGQPLTTRDLVSDLVVKPGDSVRIQGESVALKLIVMGEARGSGRIGDRVLVKNLQSGLMFQAVIVDEGLVTVKF
jgi:flagella basal body P-ring formation protein FlgA